MTSGVFSGVYSSPLGRLRVTGDGGRISGIALVTGPGRGSGVLPARVRQSLDGYFRGRPQKSRFALKGTPFQKKVWAQLASIPWGSSVSYAELARRIRKPRAVRAVANAVGSNPVAVLVPCHRVIASDGSLGGYAYGLKKKRWLLRHESKRARGRRG